MRADLLLIGFGNVARRFVRLLDELRPRLSVEEQLEWRVAGIATARHGTVYAARGLDVNQALALVERGDALDVLRRPGDAAPRDGVELIERAGGGRGWRVVVETTVLDILEAQPALAHVRAAIDSGADVITANKGPVSFAYADLRARAARAGVLFRFEGAVMDGVPVFNLVREALPAVSVQGFRGVVNTTTNHILVGMEQGRSFGDALAEMQAAGIAEADPSLDVDGWDAAAKVAAMANVWLDARMTPHDVARTGVRGVTTAQVQAAVARGRRVKLVARARRRERGVEATVAPEELPVSDLLAALDGHENALVIETDVMGRIAVTQLTSNLTQTAYALVSDLVGIARQRRAARRAARLDPPSR